MTGYSPFTDIQAGNIDNTIKRVETNTYQEFEKQKKATQAKCAPNCKEFLKICSLSATIEGGISAGLEFVQKLKSRKRLSNFTEQDFKDIGAKLIIDSGKGAFRGGLVYIATNIYKLPASIVSGIVTALYGICQEGYLLFKKRISKEQFTKDSIFIMLQTAASMLGTFPGKKLIKNHPVIGTLAGSVIGSTGAGVIYKIAFA